MVIGVVRLTIHIHESQSLKDKRAVLRSLKARIESRYKVAVAEVGPLQDRQNGVLAIVCVSNNGRHADETMGHIVDFAMANAGDGSVDNVETEILHLG